VRTVDEDYDNLLGQRQRWAEEGEADEPTVSEYYLHIHMYRKNSNIILV